MNDKIAEAQKEIEEEKQEYNDAFDAFAKGEEPAAEEVVDDKPDDVSDESTKTPTPAYKDPDDGDDESLSPGSGKTKRKPAGTDPYSWINELPEEYRSQAEQLHQHYNSQLGRVASYEGKLEEYRTREQARLSAQSDVRPTPDTATPEELPEELKEFAQQYPELAEKMQLMGSVWKDATTTAVQKELSTIKEEMAYNKLQAAKRVFEKGANKLLEEYGTDLTYREVLTSPQYGEYVGSQPAPVQDIIRKTTDPDTALWVLQQYLGELQRGAMLEAISSQDDKPPKKDKKSTLKSHVTPSSRSALTDEGDAGLSYEDQFNTFADQNQKT